MDTVNVIFSHGMHKASKMSRFTADRALEMVFMEDSDDLDFGGELDIEEDPDFPLPHYSDSEIESDEEQLPRDPNSETCDPTASDSEDRDPSPSAHSSDLGTDSDDDLGEGKQI